MDEFNNNPFNEEKSGVSPADPCAQQGQQEQPQQYQQPLNYDPYNQQPAQGQQYAQNQQQYDLPPQNGQNGQNPYGAQGGFNYNQQNVPQGGYVPPQGYYANQGYGYNAPYQQPQQSTGMAVASLVLGILSICTGLFMFNVPFLFLLPIIGIILGIVFKCKKLPVGKGMSTAGIITSAIGLAIPLALLAFVIVMLLTHGAELMQYLKEISPDQYEQLYEIYGDQFPQWFDAAVSFLIK
ncbi:MAG: hypothetical protein K1W17_04545 [Oscillospiraceae bacterium]